MTGCISVALFPSTTPHPFHCYLRLEDGVPQQAGLHCAAGQPFLRLVLLVQLLKNTKNDKSRSNSTTGAVGVNVTTTSKMEIIRARQTTAAARQRPGMGWKPAVLHRGPTFKVYTERCALPIVHMRTQKHRQRASTGRTEVCTNAPIPLLMGAPSTRTHLERFAVGVAQAWGLVGAEQVPVTVSLHPLQSRAQQTRRTKQVTVRA